MIQIQNLSKSFGEQVLFEEATWVLGKGEKLGLVGRNGHGKSTLFKIITGEEIPDGGSVMIPNQYKLGVLEQHLHFEHPTVLAEACTALEPDEFGLIPQHKAEAILGGLGFSPEDQAKAPSLFSGGYQIRINLAKLLLSEPDLLLLDEPTNYLDIVSMRWLQRFLNQWRGELILITHDRDFMVKVCSHTLGIHRKRFRKIAGTPADLYQLIAQEEELYAKTLENDQKKREQTMRFVNRFRAQANKAKQVQSRLKQLEKNSPLEALSNEKNLQFQFPFSEVPGKRPIRLFDCSFQFPNGPQILDNFSLEIFHGDRIAIVGANGKGKSTLLRIIQGELDADKGERLENDRTQIGYFGQTHIQRLHPLQTIEEEIAQELPAHSLTGQARSIAGLMLFEGDQSQKRVEVLSGGERSRVLIGKLLAKPTNCLLLDEPTHHLDMESVESLVEALEDYPGTLIIVTHSEEIAHRLATRLVVFDNQEISVYDGPYQEFLNRKGWAQDNPGSETKKGNDRKEDRRQRAQRVQERNKVLKPLERAVSKIESKIETTEGKIAELQEQLIAASTAGDSSAIVEAGKEMAQLEKQLEELYEQFEEATHALEEKAQEFE